MFPLGISYCVYRMKAWLVLYSHVSIFRSMSSPFRCMHASPSEFHHRPPNLHRWSRNLHLLPHEHPFYERAPPKRFLYRRWCSRTVHLLFTACADHTCTIVLHTLLLQHRSFRLEVSNFPGTDKQHEACSANVHEACEKDGSSIAVVIERHDFKGDGFRD